jgi:hypothetical protein|tara:strand:+ start:541 stop:975 length:435 start_codon:yes stop_codon:yes gene_type:complete
MAEDTARYFSGLYNQSPGISSVGSYQIAGTPFITGGTVTGTGEVEIKFPAVPKSITIINKDPGNDDLYVHFASISLAGNPVINNKHYITLDTQDTSVTMNVKCRSIFLSAPVGDATYELYAELTGIATEMMADLNVLSWPGVSD